MPDATDSQHPTSCNEDRKRSLEKRRDTVGQLTSKFQAYFFSGKFAQLFCLQRRHVGHTNFGTWGLVNSISPFFGRSPSSCARKQQRSGGCCASAAVLGSAQARQRGRVCRWPHSIAALQRQASPHGLCPRAF